MEQDLVKKARKNFKSDSLAWKSNYDRALEDMRFCSDDDGAQWDTESFQKMYRDRLGTGRPVISSDKLDQFINVVVNEARQNTPSIWVYPSDARGSEEVAEAYKGLIREIEQYSDADSAYDNAISNSVRCGIGFLRVDHEYVEGSSGPQRVCIKRVVNPLSVYIDGNSIGQAGEDAVRAYVLDEISVEDFKSRYTGKDPVSFEAEKDGEDREREEETVRICEYYEIEEGEGRKVVRRYMLSGADVLEETVFPGEFIPIVPVYGAELWVNGKRHILSLIRKAKDAQRRANLWLSIEAELALKAPQASFTAAEGQVEDYAEDYLNPEKTAVLRYNAKDSEGNLIGPPQRVAPVPVHAGVLQATAQAVQDIRETLGLYEASIGMPSNEKSGIAIRERRLGGNTATYHFGDNLVRGITQVGRVIVSMIPDVYTEPTILRVVGMDDDVRFVGVNGGLSEKQERTVDFSSGKYMVRVKTGAAFATRRQESAEFLSGIIQSNPEMMSIFGDIMFKNMDFAGADVMAERIRKVMNPSVLNDEEENPVAVQLGEQLKQSAAVIQQLQAELSSKQKETEIKVMAEQNDAQEARARLELEARKMEMESVAKAEERKIKAIELDLKAREIALKEKEMLLDAARATSGVVPDYTVDRREF